jgi:hypothetical protein
MRRLHSGARLVGYIVCLSVASAAEAGPVSTSDVYRDALSRQSFETFLPVLRALKPNDNLSSIEAHRTLYSTQRKDDFPIIVMPGWIGSLSGGSLGGFFLLGGVSERGGDRLSGTHVFGYVRQEGIVIPRFLVLTEATVISATEYSRLTPDEMKSAGMAKEPGSRKPLHFRDLHVRETRALSFIDELEDASVKLKPTTASDFHDWLLSEQSFHEIEEKLRALAPGTSFWDVFARLDARIMAPDFTEHTWLIRGYLASDKFPPQFLGQENGVYSIWPFGYTKKKREMPQLVLVFKNDHLLRVTPFKGNWKMNEYIAE